MSHRSLAIKSILKENPTTKESDWHFIEYYKNKFNENVVTYYNLDAGYVYTVTDSEKGVLSYTNDANENVAKERQMSKQHYIMHFGIFILLLLSTQIMSKFGII